MYTMLQIQPKRHGGHSTNPNFNIINPKSNNRSQFWHQKRGSEGGGKQTLLTNWNSLNRRIRNKTLGYRLLRQPKQKAQELGSLFWKKIWNCRAFFLLQTQKEREEKAKCLKLSRTVLKRNGWHQNAAFMSYYRLKTKIRVLNILAT